MRRACLRWPGTLAKKDTVATLGAPLTGVLFALVTRLVEAVARGALARC